MNQKMKRRGFVMTGGGAKGLYEAGVIHAFHLVGMEFDIITGSSIGAFNSVFYAEYLYRKKQLPVQIQEDPLKSIEAMDSMVKAYHHAWLQLPEKKIIDDSQDGTLGKLVEDLLQFDINLPDLTRIFWWLSDPDRGSIPSPGVWPAVLKLGSELKERIGGAGHLLRIFKNHRSDFVEHAVRAYLSRFDMEKSLIPPEDDSKLSSIFTELIEPLKVEYLKSGAQKTPAQGLDKVALVAPGRTLKDYANAGIDVRLTRANYRTGRLEISMYLTAGNFIQYLQKHAFRLERTDPEKIPLGSFRLQVPGNPDAIAAALASGRFPGVLAPYPVKELYPFGDPENMLIHKMLINWLDDDDVKTKMTDIYKEQNPDSENLERWERTYDRWRSSEGMRDFFPQEQDVYIDGGAIDNTPSNSAVDATREWIEVEGKSKRDVELDLYIVYLHPEPVVETEESLELPLHRVISRTLKIQGAAKQSSDTVVVKTINTFGSRAEDLGETLMVVLESFKEHMNLLSVGQREEILDSLREQAREAHLRGFLGRDGEGILERIESWAGEIIKNKLPLQVNEVVIYPDAMPMDTLQFTERLGYRQDNAIDMLTMGCYRTLEAILSHLLNNSNQMDKKDQQALNLTMKWMGIDQTPVNEIDLSVIQKSWMCQRTTCVFHASLCPHGAGMVGG
jgi:predicted acylesterase/phospholipase RssA